MMQTHEYENTEAIEVQIKPGTPSILRVSPSGMANIQRPTMTKRLNDAEPTTVGAYGAKFSLIRSDLDTRHHDLWRRGTQRQQ